MLSSRSATTVAYSRLWLLLILGLGLLALAYGWWRSAAAPAEATEDTSLISLLSGENTAGYARALEPGAIEFPRDLGPHNDYQTEWWYYTGNLATADGRPFGYQLTFFRRALTPPTSQVPSASQGETASPWRTNQVYLAHFTISDIATGAFYPAERFSRGAAGLAGAQAVPYRVWLEDWSVQESGPGMAQLHAQTAEVALDLELRQTLPPVLHGDAGLSPKGEEPENASYYYSIVRQETTGTLRIGDQAYNVAGLSWKDHEYSTSALSEGAVGWDWFSLQLDNGAALMFFQIRHQDGTLEPASSGTFIMADGSVQPLRLEEWQMEVLDTWTSPTSGAQYPAAWRIRLPALELEMVGRPLLPNQELSVSTVYWEGAVEFSGLMAGRPVTARGYIEMTGYFATMKGRL